MSIVIRQEALVAWLLFAVEPTDRALDGWCGAPGADRIHDESQAGLVLHCGSWGGC